MATGTSFGDEAPKPFEKGNASGRPDWADGLRQLYDSVVDEPLPDTFKDLLDRLDETDSEDNGCEANGSERGQS
ncbi:MAG: NepR family anti-sigma factor [Pseudomonadota bacterium]